MKSEAESVLPKIEMVSLDSIHKNPDNPRIIKDDKFKKLVESIKNFPEMLNIRTIVVDQEMMILGGNMRYEACKAAGLKEVPIIIADFTEEQKREFTIKDNVPFGEFNWSELANEWDVSVLKEWGVDVPALPVEDVDLDEDDSKESSGLEQCTCPKCGFKWNKENG